MVDINWGALLSVAIVSFGAAVGVVVLIAFALVGLSARATGAVVGSAVGGGPATPERGPRATLSPAAGTAVAGLCLLATAAIVGYGLWIIIS